MFSGTHYHQLDDKGRFRIPPEYREDLGSEPKLFGGLGKCIMLYSGEAFTRLIEDRFKDADFLDPRIEAIKQIIFPNTQKVKPDSQGRVLLNENLAKAAGITKNIVSIGVYDHVEIWDEDAYKAHVASLDADQIVRSLIK